MLVAMSSNLEQMDPSEKSKTHMPMSMAMPVNMVAQQVPSTNKQSAQMDMLPRFCSPSPISMAPNPYQLAFSNEQRMQMGLLSNIQAPTSAYMGFQQLSSTSSFPTINVQNPMYANAASLLSASKKRSTQRQALTKLQNSIGINQGSQQFSSTNKRPSQAEPFAKVQTESFESVRLKLRESLATSLAMVSEHQNKPQASEKNSLKGSASTSTQAEVDTGSVELTSTTSNPSACRHSPDTLAFNEHNTKSDAKQVIHSDAGLNGNMGDQEASKHDAQEGQTTHSSLESDQEVRKHDATTHARLENETLISTNPIINGDLLLGHGLCWASDVDDGSSEIIMNQDLKRPKLLHEEVTEKPKLLDEELSEKPNLLDEEVTGNSKEATLQKNAETLAIKIEAELFKLFGGVNKKYKEKGRSLLFNLKDRNNPELRERVLSGDIAPERLCSMTAEELASKELSQWRLAKAEERAQMVVLPDSEVDIRRLVRKTHKGEFQVEVDLDNSVSVEVAVGKTVVSRLPPKASGVQAQLKTDDSETKPLSLETRASEGLSLPEKGDSGDQNDSSNLDTLLCEKTDFMQDIMVDELKDNEFLPPIVSLDEFMQDLDSEPPFDNLSMGTSLCENNSDNVEPEMDPESDSSEPKSGPELYNLTSKLDSSEDISGSKLSPPNNGSNDREEIAMGNSSNVETISRPANDIKSSSVTLGYAEPDICLRRSRSEQIWEGILQLNISALASVICFFRSGEKTSIQEWPSFLEIKGRVRLDAFEKFLQELRLSRSRAIMIVQFCWKEGSHESGHSNMCETINSYIADQRVGFAEPSPGVELYFCPPHLKTTEMLTTHLPRDHTETLQSNKNDGLIGVVVWRRPHVTTISPRMSSHHKRKYSSSRKQHQTITNSISRPDDETVDDVPPGFGPGNRNARDEGDLPEFNFAHSSTGSSRAPSLPPPLARPVEQMRELIEKYGKGGVNTSKSSWNDDGDIPEWQPNSNPNPNPNQLQKLPPPPPPPQLLPPPLPQPHNNNYQQQPFVMNQNQLMPQAVPLPMPLQPPMLHPQLGFMQGQLNNNVNPQMGYMQGQLNNNANPPMGFMQGQINNNANNANTMWPSSALGGQMMQPCNLNFSGQPASNGQFYGASAAGFVAAPGQNFAMGWRPNVPRNSGV